MSKAKEDHQEYSNLHQDLSFWYTMGKAQVFTNASFRAADGKAGFSYTIWFDSSWVHVGFTDGSKLNSPKKAEVRAILHSLKEATSQGFNKTQLLLDAYKVILAINGLMDWSIHLILLDIKDFNSKFEEISFAYVPENVNVFAHELAKLSYGSSSYVRLGEVLQPR
ncbi:hypothetical protein AAC387_Pa03g0466 [Persea americana]